MHLVTEGFVDGEIMKMALIIATLAWRQKMKVMQNNKTIKDGDIAPWSIWNKLYTWPYDKIWTKRKEKNKEKRLNHRKGEDGRAFPFFAASLRAFGAQALCMQNVFFSSDVSSVFDRFGNFDHLGPSWTISDHLGQFQIALHNFKLS